MQQVKILGLGEDFGQQLRGGMLITANAVLTVLHMRKEKKSRHATGIALFDTPTAISRQDVALHFGGELLDQGKTLSRCIVCACRRVHVLCVRVHLSV